MSPSWRDRVNIFFGPGHVHLARHARGWKAQPGMGLSVACGDAKTGAWQPALETLAPPGGWAHVGPSGAGHFVHMEKAGQVNALLGNFLDD